MKKGPRLKIGIIGVGVMGSHHARVISMLPEAKLVGVVDLDFNRAQEIAQKYDTQVYSNYHELLPHVEGVIIAAPAETHFQMAIDGLNAKKHLLIEKPFTKTSGEAYKLIELAKEKNLVLSAGLIERFNPCLEVLLKLIKKDRPIGLDFKRLSPFPERIKDTNVIFDMMIHDLDLLSILIPEEIESIKAEGEKIRSNTLDRVIATIYFKSGLFARLDVNRIFGIKTRKITVCCEKKIYEADLLEKRVYVKDFETPIPSVVAVKEVDQLTAELTDFLRAIKTKKPPKATGENAYRAIQLGEEIERLCS